MPPKGKQGTKGQKQIAEENTQTLKHYTYVASAANVIYLLVQYFVFWNSFTALPVVMFIISLLIYLGSYYFMATMAKISYGPSGNVIDGGIDLNMEDGMGEHSKDLILLTAGVQILTLLSNYFWLLLLLAPGRAFYMLWVNILAPWFFAPAPEVDEKKQKKMERRMKRH